MTLESEYLEIRYLHENGFVRKKCPKCGKFFWTTDEERITCGDPPCESYTFIGNPVFNKRFNLQEMREFYLNFFEKRGHERIARYPVVARWRDDIYLTIASIADFQPFVTSGVAPPPANPLTISQPCIRLDDLDSVGRTGRHLTLFEMMAHHAFNNPKREIYWKDETVAYCTELLNKLGVKTSDIIYKEEPWAGGGNAGPCLEAIVGGLELATLVFMNLELNSNGAIEIKGEKYRKMDNYIVDTGYGLERFVWASKGSPTVYDAIFPEVVGKIVENSGNIRFSPTEPEIKRAIIESSKVAGILGELRGEKLLKLRQEVATKVGMEFRDLESIVAPLEKAYALADHTRCILFMLGDGLVPSNAGAGYLARLMIRRSLRLAEELKFNGELFDLVELHWKTLGFEFEVPLEIIQEILEIEKDRYKSTISRGLRLINRLVSRKRKVSRSDLVELYDSHGLPAELVAKVAKERGVEVDFPEDFYAELAKKHSKAEKRKEEVIKLSKEYPKTQKLYYEDPKTIEFDGTILGIEGNYVILDKTAFYPESGGQDHDTGHLMCNGRKYRVSNVIEVDGVILHEVSETSGLSGRIRGIIDFERRMRHMRHHSATHILLYALRSVLGNQVWQAGARKEESKARLDITHFRRPSDEEIRKVEHLVNREVLSNKPIKCFWMNRIDAERKYGFRLYQGGVPPGREIRIVQVGNDIQACGGTHCNSTGEIGLIKVLKVESIQDGVIRLEFAAGEAALEAIENMESILRDSSQILRIEPSMLPKTVLRFFEEWKNQKKEIERLKEEIAKMKAELLLEKAEEFDSIRVVTEIVEADMQELLILGNILSRHGAVGCLMSKRGGKVLVVTFSGSRYDARDIIREVGRYAKGSGGGKREIAQGAAQKLLSKEELAGIIFEFLSKHD